MSRRQKLLVGLQQSDLLGLEIGPLADPVARRSDGPVIYVDHLDTAALRKKYSADPTININNIVDVDAVWGEQTLAQCIGEDRKVDYVVASHVIEHVPNLIAWLEEIESVLTASGQVRLAIPDRRFTFDFFRNETRLSEVVAAWAAGARRPQPQQIVDFVINVATVDVLAAWRGEAHLTERPSAANLSGAKNLVVDSIQNGSYHDVHCWVFTPSSFAALMQDLVRAGMINFRCDRFYDTAPNTLEFFVSMEKMTTKDEAMQSWQAMKDAARHLPCGSVYARAGTDLPAASNDELTAVLPELKSALGSLTDFLVDQRRADMLGEEIVQLKSQLNAIRESTSWRLTEPCRVAVDAIRRRRGSSSGRYRG